MATLAGMLLCHAGYLKGGAIHAPNLLAILLGVLLMGVEAALWFHAVILQRIASEIRQGALVTTGVYALVRNPIYSAFLLILTGVLLCAHNLYLLLLPILYYAFLTLLMKHTEEKWLLERFGEPYAAYCKRVNRIIPWVRK